MNPTPVGVDNRKVCVSAALHRSGISEIVSKRVNRARFLDFFANRQLCLIGMEACGGAHHWARQLTKMGHQVKLMPAKFAKAFNIRNKNDAADARALWLAVQRRFNSVYGSASRSRDRTVSGSVGDSYDNALADGSVTPAKPSPTFPARFTADELAELLAIANSPEFGHLPPSQIVPRLADQQRYIASESTFYRKRLT